MSFAARTVRPTTLDARSRGTFALPADHPLEIVYEANPLATANTTFEGQELTGVLPYADYLPHGEGATHFAEGSPAPEAGLLPAPSPASRVAAARPEGAARGRSGAVPRAPVFRPPTRALYHEGMLIVKLRASARAVVSAMTMSPEAGAPGIAGAMTPGLASLASLARAGAIRRIVPLSTSVGGSAAAAARGGPLAALATPVARTASGGGGPAPEAGAGGDDDDPSAGVSIVELERQDQVEQVRVEMARDPNVVYADRVAVRYIVASARRSSGAGARSGGGGGSRRAGSAGRGTVATPPPPSSTMWNLQRIQWAEARALNGFRDAGNIRVAVLDSGIDTKHPDLRGRVKRYTFSHPDLPDVSGGRDLIGHGTHVAGTIAALVNSFGINGICDCELSAWKIFDDVPDYDPWTNQFVYFVEPVMYRRALADCLRTRQQVINLSIGGEGEPDAQERELFQALIDAGVVVVAAMGNARQEGSPTSYPAAIDGVIAVGATNIDDSVAYFSNAGNHISLAAPGVGIWSTLPRYRGQRGFAALPGRIEGKPLERERNYAAWNGTSMASPHVAAAAALLLANKGAMAPAAVRQALMDSADEVPDMSGNFDADFGAGRLNLLRLLS